MLVGFHILEWLSVLTRAGFSFAELLSEFVGLLLLIFVLSSCVLACSLLGFFGNSSRPPFFESAADVFCEGVFL